MTDLLNFSGEGNIIRVTLKDSNKYIGYLYMEVDGYYVYQPVNVNGCWSAYEMRIIADKLDELNKDWDEQVRKIQP